MLLGISLGRRRREDKLMRFGPDENVARRAPLRGLGVSSPVVWEISGDRDVPSRRGAGDLRSPQPATLMLGSDPAIR